MGRHSAPDNSTNHPTATTHTGRHGIPTVTVTLDEARDPGLLHTCNPDRPGKPLPYGKPAPNICARCAERVEERKAGIAPRPAPYWVRNAITEHTGYPTDAERARHFGPGGPHRAGTCGPVCTFGDY